MPVYIGFLRAVNVGKRQYPMAELRAALEEAGFADVETHIQSGNVRVRTPKRSTTTVSAALEEAFEADRGWPVPTVVLTTAELTEVVADADELPGPAAGFGQYVELLRSAPAKAAREQIEGQDRDGERYYVRGRAVHLVCDIPYNEVKPASSAVKRALGDSTNRNLKVLRTLAEKWCSS